MQKEFSLVDFSAYDDEQLFNYYFDLEHDLLLFQNSPGLVEAIDKTANEIYKRGFTNEQINRKRDSRNSKI